MTKIIRIILFCNFLLLFSVTVFFIPRESLAAQEEGDQSSKAQIAEQYLFRFLEALKHKDEKTVEQLWQVDHDEYNKSLKISMEDLFEKWDRRDFDSYCKQEEKRRPAYKKALEGMTYYYQLENDKETIQVEFGMNFVGKEPQMDAFYFTVHPKPIGGLSTWRQFNTAQWIMAVVAVSEVIFSFYTVILCLKEKPKLWAAWVPFILIMYGGVCLTFNQGIKVGAFIYTFFLPRILTFSNSRMQIFLSVPIGAIVYYMWRKKKRQKNSES